MRRILSVALLAALLPAGAFAESHAGELRASLPAMMEEKGVMIDGLDLAALSDEQVVAVAEILETDAEADDMAMAIEEVVAE